MKAQSKRSIERMNERINGKQNARDLEFVEWVKRAPTEELSQNRNSCFEPWRCIAIDRELGRRDGASRENR